MQAINNAESIAKFRQKLSKLVDKLGNALKDTESAVDSLAQTWKDVEFQKFNTQFAQDKKQIKPLALKIWEFEGVTLLRKQQKIEQYLGGTSGGGGYATAAAPNSNVGGNGVSQQGRTPLSKKEIDKLWNPDPQREEVDKYKKVLKDADVSFKDGEKLDYDKLDKAISAKYGYQNEDDLVLKKFNFDQDRNLQGKPFAGVVTGKEPYVAKINSKHSRDICDELETVAHEAKHVNQHHADYAERMRMRNGHVDPMRCEGNKMQGVYNKASDSCKIAFEDYLKSPAEAPAYQEGANMKQACEELRIEQSRT